MSFFKKLGNLAAAATNLVEGNEKIATDEGFDELKKQFSLEKKVMLQCEKDVKNAISKLDTNNTIIKSFSDNLAKRYSDNDRIKMHLEKISGICESFSDDIVQKYKDKLSDDCLAKLSNLKILINAGNKSIDKREEQKLKFERVSGSVKKMMQKGSEKLEFEKERKVTAEKEFKHFSDASKQSICKVLNQSHKVYDPVVANFYEATAKYCEEMANYYQKMGSIASKIKKEMSSYKRKKITYKKTTL